MSSNGFAGLRDRLHAGAQMLGTFVIVPRVEIVETAAAAGFDVVVLDCEHGPFGVETLPPLLAAARGAGVHAVVRVPPGDAHSIGAALDCGADGVLVPHVGSGEDARRVAEASRFPPVGIRSLHPWVRGARYGSSAPYVETADRSTAVLAMVEGQDAHTELDAIVGTAGIDGAFVGPLDLAVSLGLGATPGDARVTAAARDIVGRSAAAGKVTAIFAPTPEDARGWFAAGVGLVVLSVDTALVRSGFEAAVEAARPRGKAHATSSRVNGGAGALAPSLDRTEGHV